MPHYLLDARTATPHFPGIGRYAANLARSLAGLLTSNERLTVLCPPHHPPVLPASARVQVLPVAASPFSLSQQWQIPRLLRHLRADVYHSAYVMMPYAPGAPTVLTLYDLIPLLLPEQSSRRARWLVRWVNRLGLHAARQALAVSEATRDDYIRHLRADAKKITAIPLAADPVFRPLADRRQLADLLRRYALPEAYVLYVGSNRPHKNLVRLVEAWQAAGHSCGVADHRLVIAGAWDQRYPEARRRAEQLALEDRVMFLGPVAELDLPALYNGAQLFVFVSLYEGFGLPVLEAMACGTPVVCSNRSSLPEVAADAALLVNPLDVGAMAEAIGRALCDEALRGELRVRGLAQAQRFTWQETARRTLAIYREQAKASA